MRHDRAMCNCSIYTLEPHKPPRRTLCIVRARGNWEFILRPNLAPKLSSQIGARSAIMTGPKHAGRRVQTLYPHKPACFR